MRDRADSEALRARKCRTGQTHACLAHTVTARSALRAHASAGQADACVSRPYSAKRSSPPGARQGRHYCVSRPYIARRSLHAGAGQGGHGRVSPLHRETLAAHRSRVRDRAGTGGHAHTARSVPRMRVRDRADTTRTPIQREALAACKCGTGRTRACLAHTGAPRIQVRDRETRGWLAYTLQGTQWFPALESGARWTRVCRAHTSRSAPRTQVRGRADCRGHGHVSRLLPRQREAPPPARGFGTGRTRACLAHTARSARRTQVRDRVDT